MRATLTLLTRGLTSRGTRSFLIGMLAGTLVAFWIWCFVSLWGATLPVASALIVALAISCGLGLHGPSLASRRFRPLWLVLAAVWTLALPALVEWTQAGLAWIPLAALESSWTLACLSGLAAIATMGPPVNVLTRLLIGDRRLSLVAGLLGAATALLLAPVTIAFAWGPLAVGWIAAAACTIWAAAEWRLPQSIPADDEGPTENPVELPYRQQILDGCLALLCGMSIAAAGHIASQLVVETVFVAAARWGGIVLGVAAGVWACRPMPFRSTSLIAAGSVLLLCGVFPMLVEFTLVANSSLSSLWLAVAVRCLLMACCAIPGGMALGLALRSDSTGPARHAGPMISLAAAGCVTLQWFGAASTPAVIAIAACGLALAVWEWFTSRQHWTIRGRVSIAAAMALMPAAPFLGARFDPALSARLLYSAPALLASRAETPFEQLCALDDSRLLARIDAGGSTWTAWKQRGTQVLLRRNGVPQSVTSLDPAVCPQSSAEIAPVVLPLVIHHSPRRVALAGLDGTASLSTCLAFPIETLTCIEPESGRWLMADELAALSGSNPLEDPRVETIQADSALATACAAAAEYDVVIVDDSQTYLTSGVNRFTQAYYARWSSRLAPDGVLCQRFQYADCGSRPLQELASTLLAVFPQIVVFEVAPGELAFVALKSEGPVVDDATLERASAGHVRRVMSQAGWDWSVVAALAALDPDATREIAAMDGVQPNTTATGVFAFRLPLEVMRWGPKGEEIHRLLGDRTTPLLTWIDDHDAIQEVSKRLADVTEQHRVIRENPDFAWEYRKSLRQRLQDRPRSTIQQVSGEGLQRVLDPEDKRRKEFLVALGEAATQARPQRVEVRTVEQFVEPYDPLVSYFVHHEAAHLLARAEPRDVRAELRHRLHGVHFGAGHDLSVRGVVSALELALDSPEAAGNAEARWDTYNSLLEALRQRWDVRRRDFQPTRYSGADIEASLAVAERAIDAMDDLAGDVPGVADDWTARQEILDDSLLKILRNLRSRQARSSTHRTPQQPSGEDS